MLLFKTIKQIFLTISMHISPKIYFCRILLFTERILLHQITNVSPAGDKLSHLLTACFFLQFDFPWELQLFRCTTTIGYVMHDEFFILIFPGSFSYSDVPSYSDKSRVARVLYVKSGVRKK